MNVAANNDYLLCDYKFIILLVDSLRKVGKMHFVSDSYV